MQDDQLLQDLAKRCYPEAPEKFWQRLGITTYSQLLKLIEDDRPGISLRANACYALQQLWSSLDKQRVIPPLIIALKSGHELLQIASTYPLGAINADTVLLELGQVLLDKENSQALRSAALHALSHIGNKQAAPTFRKLIYDETDNLELRFEALIWMPEVADEYSLDDYITMLSHDIPDLRFGAAHVLEASSEDISKALPILDELAAFDRSIPAYWGWHVGRHAIGALERIYSQPFKVDYIRNYDECITELISPTAEYDTFLREYRQRTESGRYITLSVPDVALKVDPKWLAERLHERWPEVILNNRQPRPKTYLLDWQLQISGKYLIGGLHRDCYGVVITGHPNIIDIFSNWYRSIIPSEYPLFCPMWAGKCFPL